MTSQTMLHVRHEARPMAREQMRDAVSFVSGVQRVTILPAIQLSPHEARCVLAAIDLAQSVADKALGVECP